MSWRRIANQIRRAEKLERERNEKIIRMLHSLRNRKADFRFNWDAPPNPEFFLEIPQGWVARNSDETFFLWHSHKPFLTWCEWVSEGNCFEIPWVSEDMLDIAWDRSCFEVVDGRITLNHV